MTKKVGLHWIPSDETILEAEGDKGFWSIMLDQNLKDYLLIGPGITEALRFSDMKLAANEAWRLDQL